MKNSNSEMFSDKYMQHFYALTVRVIWVSRENKVSETTNLSRTYGFPLSPTKGSNVNCCPLQQCFFLCLYPTEQEATVGAQTEHQHRSETHFAFSQPLSRSQIFAIS